LKTVRKIQVFIVTVDFVERQSRRSSPGHGGKRAGAGRKPTGTISLHLRVSPKALFQITAMGRTRGAVVTEAIAEKFGRWQRAKEKAAQKAHERLECLDDPKIKEWIDEVRTKLAPHQSVYCHQAEILAEYASDVVEAQRADTQERLEWLIVEAKRYDFNLWFTIKPDGHVGYYWKQRRPKFTYTYVNENGNETT
jgi:hypothetical protein